MKHFTFEDFLHLADEVYTLTGERVVAFYTTPKVLKHLVGGLNGFVRLEADGIPIIAHASMSPDTIRAVTKRLT